MFRIFADSIYKASAACARRLLVTAAVLALPAVALAQQTGVQDIVLDNPGDPNFNQLLGINNARVIVGYFGDGTIVPNNGYVLVPQNHYAVENFTNLESGDFATETQAIGIDNNKFPDIVGFYTDHATGFTHGWVDSDGQQLTIDDPEGSQPNVTTPNQNLLGINDSFKAAGFWTDNNGHEHGFVVGIDIEKPSNSTFTEIPPSMFAGAVATQVSDITNKNEICGFWTDTDGNNHGFFGQLGSTLTTFNVTIKDQVISSTTAFGCNDSGEIVGSYTDSNGNVHGFTYESGKYTQFDAKGSSQTPAFGVQGTFINGVNDSGDIVGFYSDGAKVNGFVRLN
jgi:hypothetical protein